MCLYCGGSGHFLKSCPVKERCLAVKKRILSGGVSIQKASSTLLPVRLQWATRSHRGQALLDSGAEGNFMDWSFAQQLQIPTITLTNKISVNALNGQQLPTVSHTTSQITLITYGNHSEELSFFLMDSPQVPIVLGHPWLVRHYPRVDWGHNSVSAWSTECYASC